MRIVCLNFHIHQPFRLIHFPFSKIGENQCYFDENLNSSILKEESLRYLTINRHLLRIIQQNPERFKINFCISGTALDQFAAYAPEVLHSFQELSKTGQVEFLGTTDAQSLAALISRDEFANQVKNHSQKVKSLFGKKPKVFFTPRITYTGVIEEILFRLGFKKILFSGIPLSPEKGTMNQIFKSSLHKELKILRINQSLSDPINLLIGTQNPKIIPTTPENLINRILNLPEDQRLINLNLYYSHLGNYISKGIHVFDFLYRMVELALKMDIRFQTFTELDSINIETLDPLLEDYSLISKQKKEGLYPYLGNRLQMDAFYNLYDLEDLVSEFGTIDIAKSWLYLQSSDHFYYMNTDYPDDFFPSPIYSPYPNPYQAYINYMNVLLDFKMKLKSISASKNLNKPKVVQGIKIKPDISKSIQNQLINHSVLHSKNKSYV